MEKCFCHIKDRITGERYEVKDSEARNKIIDMEVTLDAMGNRCGDVESGYYDLLQRVDAIEAGGSGGSGSSEKLYIHNVMVESSDYYDMMDIQLSFSFISKSPQKVSDSADTWEDFKNYLTEYFPIMGTLSDTGSTYVLRKGCIRYNSDYEYWEMMVEGVANMSSNNAGFAYDSAYRVNEYVKEI